MHTGRVCGGKYVTVIVGGVADIIMPYTMMCLCGEGGFVLMMRWWKEEYVQGMQVGVVERVEDDACSEVLSVEYMGQDIVWLENINN